MGGVEAVAGRQLPAVAYADPSGSLPDAAPAHQHHHVAMGAELNFFHVGGSNRDGKWGVLIHGTWSHGHILKA